MKKSGRIFSAAQREGSSAVRTKVEVLEDLYRHLCTALEDVRSLEFSESAILSDLKPGLDFYREVKRFEIALIQRALRRCGGRQSLAASLLGLKTTTLNSKIKAYKIDWRGELHEA
jgi:transcriptional regulator with GAF, ATPase, and Fis domain